MRPFAYRRAADERDAFAAVGADAAFIAGGTDLLPLWKSGVVAPARVIDISGLPLDCIEADPRTITIGALAHLSDVAAHPLVRAECPVAAEALSVSASPQLRNMATIGGNLLQRTRCAYFRDASLPCNKRIPGTGCGARDGDHRRHAILGASAHCMATHASDLAVALAALDAIVRLRGAAGERAVPLAEFYLLPGDHPERETALAGGELIAAVDIPRSQSARRSRYLKLRDRATFDFATVSVAAAVQVEDGMIRAVRLAAGGVGTIPWRLGASEAVLGGARSDAAARQEAAERSADGARPLARNAYKIELLKRSVLRVLEDLV